MRILVAECEHFSPGATRVLEELGEVTAADLDRAGLLAAAANTEVLWVRLRNRIDAEVMDAAPGLRVICTPTTGLNHIDLAEAGRRGVRVVSLRGEVDFLKDIRATAEHTIALALALMRRLPAAVRHVEGGGWNRDPFRGNELYGKTVGVVGYGRLGRIVARYLDAFGCRVLASERPDWDGAADGFVKLVPLEELLSHSGIVTLHVNLCQATENFFDRSCFEKMRPGAWFINTARGELIDEAALLDRLKSGALSGAALDVLREEHRLDARTNPLLAWAREHGNLLLTPHIGGCTVESMAKTEEFLARQLRGLLYGGPWNGDQLNQGDHAECAELQAR